MKFFALLSSMPFESELILSQLKNVRKTEIAGKILCKGKLSNINILLMNTGIGKVNAAHSATAVIEHLPIKCIINSGAGGAYPHSGLKIGDIAIALKEIYGDDGVLTSRGWEGIKEIGIPLVQKGKKRYFNEFPLDKKFAKKALNSAKRIADYTSYITQMKRSCRQVDMKNDENLIPPNLPLVKGGRGDFRVKSGNFVTLSTTTGTHKRALELEIRFKAICENMEGAAIAQICTMYNIPMLEIRGISNIAGVRDKRGWHLKLASENCQKAVLEIISVLV